MKRLSFIIAMILLAGPFLVAQPNEKKKYPEPEFINEIYFLKKDSIASVLRLEKNSSKMETKTKLGGFGGAEMGYMLDGEKSSVRLEGGSNLSFIFYTGGSGTESTAAADSAMRANGMDPASLRQMGGMSDPTNSISLYKTITSKGKRKILIAGGGGLGGKKSQSDKYTFSLRKIREGYWELLIDKPLPKGEYAFSTTIPGANMHDGNVFFAFGVN
jgi:hypothetical protein